MMNEWNGLADLLANLIEKYASELNLDQLPYPDNKYTTHVKRYSTFDEGGQLHSRRSINKLKANFDV